MRTPWTDPWVYYDGASADVMRQLSGQFTVEETIRNFFGLYKEKIVDQAGNVIDIVDDFRNDVKLKKTWVYDYFTNKEALENLGVSEADMRKYFPYIQFNEPRREAESTIAPETPIEWGLPSTEGNTPKAKGRTRKASVA